MTLVCFCQISLSIINCIYILQYVNKLWVELNWSANLQFPLILDGVTSDAQYSLLIQPASRPQCQRCRKHTAKTPNQPCSRCVDVMSGGWEWDYSRLLNTILCQCGIYPKLPFTLFKSNQHCALTSSSRHLRGKLMMKAFVRLLVHNSKANPLLYACLNVMSIFRSLLVPSPVHVYPKICWILPSNDKTGKVVVALKD